MLRFMTTAALILTPIDVAHAHYVWLEREVTGPRVRTSGVDRRYPGKNRRSARPVQCAASFSRRKRNTAAGQAKQKNLQFAAKGHGDARSWTAVFRRARTRTKAASPKPSIMPKPAEGKPSPSSTWSWCPLKLAGKICSAVF